MLLNAFAKLQVVKAAMQSYIQFRSPDNKWCLLVAVSQKQSKKHQHMVELLHKEAQKMKPVDKQALVALRDQWLCDGMPQ